MAERRNGGTRTEMIHCEYCGEDYAASYKRCPFCDELPEDEGYDDESDSGPRGGKRLVTNARGGGYGGGPSPLKVLGTVISLALIVAAVIIIISIIKPLVDKGNTTMPTTPPVTTTSQTPEPPATVSPEATDPVTTPPVTTTVPGIVPTTPPPVTTPTIPASQTATGFTINRDDFTLRKAGETWSLKPTFTPAGATGTLTWVSDKKAVATVSDTGVVTAVSAGSATITATMPGGYVRKCIVRCTFAGGSAVTPGDTGTTAPATGSLALNHTDFTMSSTSDPAVRLKVSGTSSTPTWSSSNTGVAAVSSDGKVTAVGKGSCTVTATVDGQTLKCIVRCTFN